jgi:hypothetical protein
VWPTGGILPVFDCKLVFNLFYQLFVVVRRQKMTWVHVPMGTPKDGGFIQERGSYCYLDPLDCIKGMETKFAVKAVEIENLAKGGSW